MNKFIKSYVEDESKKGIYNKLRRVAIRITRLFLISIIALNYSSIKFSFAESILVEGSNDKLIVLTHTKYLDDRPVLIFSEQMKEMKVDLLNKIDNIMFCDNTWQDLAVEFAIQSVIVSPRSTIKIEKDGIYEVFVYSPQSKIYSPHLEIEIDGKKILQVTSFKLQVLGRKYLNIGECELKIGKHKIHLLGLNSKFLGQKESKKLKVLLINKQERQRAEEIIWQKMNERETEIAYIFSQDGKFYVPEGRSYTLNLRVASIFLEPKNKANQVITDEALLEIDGEKFSIGGYPEKEGVFDSDSFWWKLENLNLAPGEHALKFLTNNNFKVDLVILEQISNFNSQISDKKKGPKITFRKINPTKYEVKIEEVREPFWLVFSESFHKQWRLYKSQVPLNHSDKLETKGQTSRKSQDDFEDIVADYLKLGVREAKHITKFTPQDIKFLFRKPLGAPHYLVNGYANAWYIEPEKIDLPQDFILVIYFWPQSSFYLGLGIAGSTLLGCVVYLGVNFLKDRLGKNNLKL